MFNLSGFRRVLLTRFLAYFFIQVGFLALILSIEPVMVEEFKFRTDQLFGKNYSLPKVVTSQGDDFPIPSPVPDEQSSPRNQENSAGFGSLAFGNQEIITPASTAFGIVIEKINANAVVVPDVNPAIESEYLEALKKGVAHAKGTSYPGQKGNVYLFSHSTNAPWNIIRYNAVFYLLRELEKGDKIIMFYQGRRYDYLVFDKIIAKADDVEYLTKTYDESILTLQTCDPPGTVLRRLIVRAKLVKN